MAAVIIQSISQQWLCRHRFEAAKWSTVDFQRFLRPCLCRCQFEVFKRETIRIESFIGLHVLIRRRLFLSSSVQIQHIWRGHSTRCVFVRQVVGVIKLQAVVRTNEERRSIDSKKVAACLIQRSCWTCSLGVEYEKKGISARVPQGAVRAFSIRIKERAAVIIQLVVRRWLCRRRFEVAKRNAVDVQRFVRTCLCRRRFEVFKSEAIRIQSFIRLRHVLIRQRLCSSSSVQIQCRWHGHFTKCIFLSQMVSVI